MIERLRLLLLPIIIVLLYGCNPEPKKVSTYFGGKIINPKSDHVVLYFQERAIDTFHLDENQSFLKKIAVDQEGLFYFKHDKEHQYVYIEPEDSILIRLNTFNFDETLVFSGKGADRNNMLIDCFIDAERDEQKFYKLYKLEPEEFKQQVTKLEALKMRRFEQFLMRNQNETEPFKRVLKMALTYPLYSKIERYPLARRGISAAEDQIEKLDSTFYGHRNRIDLNQDSIMFFYAYRNLLVSHLYNDVFSEGSDIESEDFTIRLLNKVDEKITHDESRNTLFRQIAIGHFYRKSSCNIDKEAFEVFFKKSTNENDKELVIKLLDDVKNIHKGKKMTPFEIVDYNHAKHNINAVIKGKNAVLYFWNSDYMSKAYVASKVNYLSKKHPDVEFVGINISIENKRRIRRIDIKKQFYLSENSVANTFLTSQMPRTILINKKGVVVNGYASLSSQNIYQQVGELAKY